MRRRLVTVYLSLLVTACLGLAFPLCTAIASGNTGDMVIDRSNDTVRFASLAGPALESGETEALGAELDAYYALYDIRAWVFDRHGGVVVSSGVSAGTTVSGEELRAALAGNRSAGADTLWPWDTQALVVVEPVVRSGEVIGAVATESPTDALRWSTMWQWGVVLGSVLLVLTVGTLALNPLARWVLRPVHDLDTATRRISDGELTARVPAEAGPPELRRLSESFNRMADTITTLLSRQRTFVSYAGHQIRNPLAALRLRVDGLAAHLNSAGAADHALTLDEVDRLARICDTLLQLARTGPGRERAVDLDVREVADARVAAWLPIAERSGMDLRRCGAHHAPVRLPDGILDQALDVLIDNALKFGGAGVQVAVHVYPPRDGKVRVHVVDNGPGLAPEQLEKAAAPFWRSPDSAGAAGVGLGLSIVATLLETYDGELRLDSADPHGIDARIQVPTEVPNPVDEE
ncbi:HAMP domain-containing histidine kinase [Spiractinospora alimapuensis]|uniref:sensor histidine kinase n=1 Tax=Spiractinospora alimapuensis TaxID=2820884 RepID=UPI001F36B773|nr:HAMP domain-containing sensor histidine kinase [Spiractinospora alimapuensis]QVQ50066.1 HAMP domain-containing histidine kinase [Spiractinospora alimapuensis]